MKLWKLERKRRINKPKELYLTKYSGKQKKREGNTRKIKTREEENRKKRKKKVNVNNGKDLSEKTSVSVLKSFFKFRSHNQKIFLIKIYSTLSQQGDGSLSA